MSFLLQVCYSRVTLLAVLRSKGFLRASKRRLSGRNVSGIVPQRAWYPFRDYDVVVIYRARVDTCRRERRVPRSHPGHSLALGVLLYCERVRVSVG